jgi:hypothetical protein
MGRILYRSWKDGVLSDHLVMSDTLYDASRPSLAADPMGELLFIAWHENRSGTPRMRGCIGSGTEWDSFDPAPGVAGPQENPYAYFLSDGSWLVSWWKSDIDGIWVGNGDVNWSPINVDMYCGIGVLAEASGQLAVMTNGYDPVDGCEYVVSLWNGTSWQDPGGSPGSAGGWFDAAPSVNSSIIHLAALPGMLPTCPCWHLLYTAWNPPTGWTQEVCTEALTEWWTCTNPSVTVDQDDLPMIAYVYKEYSDELILTRQDIALARSNGVGFWRHDYQFLPLSADVDDPQVALPSIGPSVAWSGVLSEAREIWLATQFPTGTADDREFSIRSPLQIWPNPSSGSVHMRLPTSYPEGSRVEILDVTGRQVRSLIVPENRSMILWDGIDSNGQPVSSGIFLVRILTRWATRTGGTIVRIR